MSSDNTESFKGYALFDETMEANPSNKKDWYPPAGSRAAKALEHLFDEDEANDDDLGEFLTDNSQDREWVEEDARQ